MFFPGLLRASCWVIKVEFFDGDYTRRYGPPFVNGTAPYFMGLNRNKQDLGLDLSGPKTLRCCSNCWVRSISLLRN
jgi:crotonobetainyl-CoA:carnitine CoA-transferase CaiB-like acyl-CoA transferase